MTVVDGPTWDSMSAAQFAQYQVVIIGDPTCGDTTAFQAAVTNESTWEPVVMSSGGNKVLIGTDPVFHTYGGHPGYKLIGNGISYAGAVAGATGAYVDLSCAYNDSSDGTPVPLLDGLSSHGAGSFTVGGTGPPGICSGSISIIAQSGPTTGLHDSDLSGWSCSVHEFFDKFPADYTPLALATDPAVPKTYSGTDVDTNTAVQGSPYIMLSGGGVSVKSNLVLNPPSQTLTAGTAGSVTATLTSGGSPVANNPVEFDVTAGPDSGQTYTHNTDSTGKVTFTYTNNGTTGTDQILATSTVSSVTEQGTATITWNAHSGGPSLNHIEGHKFTCIERCKDSHRVASFRDATAGDTASMFAATIDWGDGTTSQGTVIPNAPGFFSVYATHGYTHKGMYTVTITITGPGGTPTYGSTTTTATIT